MKTLKKILIITLISVCLLGMTACSQRATPPQQERLSQENANPPGQPNAQSGQPLAETLPEDTVLGNYETKLLDKDPDRVNNINIAAEEISNYIIQPGEIFSFNGVIGKRKADKGYEKAKIIVNGKKKEGFGGGICQLSTTLFNAARGAGLEIVERHPHTKKVPYVPKGMDAAVNYGTMDLKFRNTKSFPIKIQAGVDGGIVHVSILKGR